jgi:hypothetical protein
MQTAASTKRGVCFGSEEHLSPADIAAVSASGIAWWYNWHTSPKVAGRPDSSTSIDFIPMMWNFKADVLKVEAYCKEHPSIRHILVLNEPSQEKQANTTPEYAARNWPVWEALAERCGVSLVGPQLCYGQMAGFEKPRDWLAAFIASYAALHGGREPRIDAIGYHFYGTRGLSQHLDDLASFGKSFWVTELAFWKASTLEEQKRWMTRAVAECESRPDVDKYAWFIGRSKDRPLLSLLSEEEGELSELGRHYVSLPSSCGRLEGECFPAAAPPAGHSHAGK